MHLATFLNKVFKKNGFILTDANSKDYIIGNPGNNPIKLKILNKNLHYKLLLHPDLYFGEAYTDGTAKIENGSLTDFLNIAFSTKSANNNNSFNLLEKFAFSSIFLFATYNFTQFVTDNPKALQVAIETAKNSEDLKKALGGGELESPFYKRIFWGGSVKNGKVQIDVPVVCKNTGKEAIIKGKGLQDAYGKNEIWFYSLFEMSRISTVILPELSGVGDSDVDIQTAKNAGILSVGVLWGFRKELELREAGADFIFRYPRHFLKFLKTVIF